MSSDPSESGDSGVDPCEPTDQELGEQAASDASAARDDQPDPHEASPSAAPVQAHDDQDAPEIDAGEVEAARVVEALLFATDTPLPASKIAQIMDVGDARSVRKHIDALNEDYANTGRAFRIEEIAGGYQMLTLPAYNPWLSKLLRVRQESRLTPAALETLAIVAYKQPVLRAEIEAIRGVAVGEVLNRLRELNLVKIVGRDEQIGRPMLYGTTKRFLEVFGLASIKDLPNVEALKAPE